MRIALYARVSTQRQAQQQTVEQQLERLRAHVAVHAAQAGWQIRDEHVFRDDGLSGATLHRPGLDRLRDAVAARALDLVMVTAPDRSGPLGAQLCPPDAAARRTGTGRMPRGIPGSAHEPGPTRPPPAADPGRGRRV
jgi:predicted site-specific integrase-resolvase